MIVDCFTKWLQGSQFRKLRDLTLGIVPGDFEKYKRRYLICLEKEEQSREREEGEREQSEREQS